MALSLINDSDEGYPDSVVSTSDFNCADVVNLEGACLGSTRHTERVRRNNNTQADHAEYRSYQKLTELDINSISGEIGDSWPKLARELGFLATKIQKFQEKPDDTERAHAMLIAFLQRDASKATRKRLADALAAERVGRRDLAERLVGEEELDHLLKDKTYVMKEEGQFRLERDPRNEIHFRLCRDVKDGQLYLLRPLNGTEFERACQTLTEEDNVAESLLRALDPLGIVNAEKERQQIEAKNRHFRETHEKLAELQENLQQIKDDLGNQEKREGHIDISAQVKECDKMVTKLQSNCTEFIRATGMACQLDDPFPVKAKLAEHLIELSSCRNDLEERIKMLVAMASRDRALTDETKSLQKILKPCRSLGKEIKMQERICQELLRLEFSENERTQSTPNPKNRPCMRLWLPRRASTQPLSQSQFREITEQVRQKAEHNENDE